MSLRWRLTLALASIATVVVFGSAIGAMLTMRHELQAEIDRTLLARVALVPPGERGPGSFSPIRGAVDDVPLNPSRPDVVAGSGAGRTTASDPLPPSTSGGSIVPNLTVTVQRNSQRGNGGRRLDSATRALIEKATAAGASPQAARFCATERRFESISAVQIITTTGKVISCTDIALPTSAAERALAGTAKRPLFRTVSIESTRFRMLTTPVPDGAVQLGRDLAEMNSVLGTLRWRLAMLGAGGIALAALAGWLAARRIVRPIESLRTAADRVATTQDLSHAVAVTGQDEVASLASSFNAMVSALATSREQQQRLIVDASHELRTPLTSLRTNLELANRSRALAPEQQRELLDAAIGEVDELTNLVGELVELSTDRTTEETLQEVVLADLCADVVQRTQRRTGREIRLERPDSPTARLVRPRMIERAIANLVENAVKYAPSGPITVQATNDQILVIDAGPGIAESDLPHVFDRFYRSDAARTEPGSGLGLSIVRQIVERHGGVTIARNNPDRGAAVGFVLPAVSR